jgi:hypothetical protein
MFVNIYSHKRQGSLNGRSYFRKASAISGQDRNIDVHRAVLETCHPCVQTAQELAGLQPGGHSMRKILNTVHTLQLLT